MIDHDYCESQMKIFPKLKEWFWSNSNLLKSQVYTDFDSNILELKSNSFFRKKYQVEYKLIIVYMIN